MQQSQTMGFLDREGTVNWDTTKRQLTTATSGDGFLLIQQ